VKDVVAAINTTLPTIDVSVPATADGAPPLPPAQGLLCFLPPPPNPPPHSVSAGSLASPPSLCNARRRPARADGGRDVSIPGSAGGPRPSRTTLRFSLPSVLSPPSNGVCTTCWG
jgi:hypothetical protein